MRVSCLDRARSLTQGSRASTRNSRHRTLQRIADYPNLNNYVKEIYQFAGIRETVDMGHIKKHYMVSHRTINPLGIVAKGPLLDFDSPHDRARLPGRPLYG